MTGRTTAGGWGWKHQQLRAAYQRRMDHGERFNCWRCGRPINPARWDLGHDDHDKRLYRGPEHVRCNRRAGLMKGIRNRKLRTVTRWNI